MMECHRQDCRYWDNGCTDKKEFDICMSAIADVQGNAEGCEYCITHPQTANIGNVTIDVTRIHGCRIVKNHSFGLLIDNSANKFNYIDIKYCPMCGRKLV